MSAKVSAHLEWGFRLLKSGKPGKTWTILGMYAECPVGQCETCGRFGSATWVKVWFYEPYRAWIDHQLNYERPRTPVQCLGCFNKVRPLLKARETVLENEALIRQINRERLREAA